MTLVAKMAVSQPIHGEIVDSAFLSCPITNMVDEKERNKGPSFYSEAFPELRRGHGNGHPSRTTLPLLS